jgi:hypothetical protein
MTTEIAEEATQKLTAILVYEQKGIAVHRYCTPEEGTQACNEAAENFCGASLFTTDAGFAADVVMAVYPAIRERIAEAKLRLQQDIHLRDALDKNNVPRDRQLRSAIKKAFEDYNTASVRRALRA